MLFLFCFTVSPFFFVFDVQHCNRLFVMELLFLADTRLHRLEYIFCFGQHKCKAHLTSNAHNGIIIAETISEWGSKK